MMKPIGFRQHHLSSSGGDRFVNFLSFPHLAGTVAAGDELNEAEVCFAGEFSDQASIIHQTSSSPTTTPVPTIRCRQLSRQIQNSGLLAALPVATPSKQIPAPRNRERDFVRPAPRCKFQKSAPVNVPVIPSAIMANRLKNPLLHDDDDQEDDEEMLPPHEIVARRTSISVRNACSVLEGAGRTLKGRDLRQVRNAIWQRTGFLD